MPLTDHLSLLCIAIEDKARRHASRIEEDASRRAEEIVKKASEKNASLLARQVAEEREHARQQAARIVDAAELRARQYVLREKNRLFLRVMDRARQQLEAYSSSARYPDLLYDLAKEAVGVIPAGGVTIRLSQRDRPLFTDDMILRLAHETERHVELSGEPAMISGGLVAVSEDGRHMIDYSFDTLVSRAGPELMKILEEKLWKNRQAS